MIDLLPLDYADAERKVAAAVAADPPPNYEAFGRAVVDYLRRAHGDFTPLVEIALRHGVAKQLTAARTTVIVFPPPR